MQDYIHTHVLLSDKDTGLIQNKRICQLLCKIENRNVEYTSFALPIACTSQRATSAFLGMLSTYVRTYVVKILAVGRIESIVGIPIAFQCKNYW